MKRQIVKTADGSNTLYLPEWDEHYHSKFGALEESMHIFVKSGFLSIEKSEVKVLEVGLGTGLNAFLTLVSAHSINKKVYYKGIEKYPLSNEEVDTLNYQLIVGNENYELFKEMHHCTWEQDNQLTNNFTLCKLHMDLRDFNTNEKFDVIYFDAFAPDLQPELWSEEVFRMLYNALESEGCLVTYSIKGSVKRSLKSVGFNIFKLKGPKGGKREILKAVKN